MDPASFLKIITNSTFMVTQLFGRDPVQFSQQQYNVTASEDTPLGPLLILRAITSPSGDPVHYSLLDGPRKGASKWFRIDPSSGLLRLVKPLDFEINKRHLFRVSAGTSRGSGETSVLVSVTDANDHAPVFSRMHYETQITEEDDRHLPKPVLQVEAVDADAGVWGVVRYSIEGDGIPENTVHIMEESTDANSINEEETSENDGQQSTRISPSRNSSSFSSPSEFWPRIDRYGEYSFEDSFSAETGNAPSIFYEMNPSDISTSSSPEERSPKRVSKPNSSIINTLLQTNSSHSILKSSFHKSLQKYYRDNSTANIPSFAVDPRTGTVYVMKPLNRDAPDGRARWTLRVTASDGQLEAVTAVQVNLKDINDNAPRFPTSMVRAAVPENAPAGTPVVTVAAHDYDDPAEATNARLVYSLQKNVIDEATGRPIFTVDSKSGRISTALCCLDREHTGRYGLLLAATDGGGLQGTCSVTVEVRDVNDVPPRWASTEWVLKVPEGQPVNSILASLPVTDPDRANRLAYRIVPGSGHGWELVKVEGRPEGGGAQLKARVPLDYEDPNQRAGITFQVQVTDQGEGAWGDRHRAGVASVSLQVVDTNDNSPVFEPSSLHRSLELSEDAATGTVLTTLQATDLDEGSGGLISYGISPPSDPGGVFAVDTGGTVRLARTLDREKNALHLLHVLAWDSGEPPNTATATVTVSVSDINDNAPALTSPRVLGLPPLNLKHPSREAITFNLTLNDPDDWAAGNGPPFSLTVDPEAEEAISSFLKLQYKPGRVSPEGGVVVPLTAVVEREMGGVLAVPLLLQDAGNPPQSSTVTLTLARSSGPRSLIKEAKFMTVASVKSTGGIGLGRVRESSGVGARYTWLRSHPLFSLNSHTGALTVAADAPTGIFEVQVSVSDVTATNVEVNVTVNLYHVTRREVTHATPIDIAITPTDLVKKDEDGNSLLQRLLMKLEIWATEFIAVPASSSPVWNVKTVSIQEVFREKGQPPATRIWLTSPGDAPPALQMLAHRNREKIMEELGTNVIDVGVSAIGLCSKNLGGCKCCCQDKILVGDNYILVDSTSLSHVGPTIHVIPYCGCSSEKKRGDGHSSADSESQDSTTNLSGNAVSSSGAGVKSDTSSAPAAHAVVGEEPPSCRPETCLNGGRCIPGDDERPKCICPTHTYGPYCKIIHREFNRRHHSGNSASFGSWAWLPGLPTCSHLHITLHLLTRNPHGLLIYTSDSQSASYNPFLALQIANGRPQLILRLGNSGSTSIITLNTTFNDHKWHRIDLMWRNQSMELIADLCGTNSGLNRSTTDDTDQLALTASLPLASNCKGALQLPHAPTSFGWGTPLQLGGRADSEGAVPLHAPPIVASFTGCIAKVQINGKLQDLGPSVLSSGSYPGCSAVSCLRSHSPCPMKSRCSGSPGQESCHCLAGYSGPGCSQPTTPVAFRPNSFVQLALSFTPPPYSTHLQLRMKTRQALGQIISLSSRHGRDSLRLQLTGGRPCLVLTLHPEPPLTLCLKVTLNDGRWHLLTATRQGSGLELVADEGEDDQYRAAIATDRHSTLLHLHRQEGVVIGGRPEYRRASHTTVHHDFFNGCLDDVRLEGKPLPLDPSQNATMAGAVSVAKGVSTGCLAPPMCLNVTCRRPFSCQDTWRQHYCGCDDGLQVSRDGALCTDINECLWSPCLNFGECNNKHPGYSCSCTSGYTGANCQHGQAVTGALIRPTTVALIAGTLFTATLTVLLIVLVVWYWYRRKNIRKKQMLEDKRDQSTTDVSFENLHLQNPSIKSSELLYKLRESRTKKAESVSVISLGSAGCDVHLNDLFEVASHGKLSDKPIEKDINRLACGGNVGSSTDKGSTSSKGPRASTVINPLMDEKLLLPCTCESRNQTMTTDMTEVDILRIPSPQMFADPPPTFSGHTCRGQEGGSSLQYDGGGGGSRSCLTIGGAVIEDTDS